MKTAIGTSIRVGSKTLVEMLEETRTQTFDIGSGHFVIEVGDKKIDCYMERGTIDALLEGAEINIPKLVDRKVADRRFTKRKKNV